MPPPRDLFIHVSSVEDCETRGECESAAFSLQHHYRQEPEK